MISSSGNFYGNEKISKSGNFVGNQTRIPRTIYIVAGVLCFGCALTFLNVYELRRLQAEHFEKTHGLPSVEADYGSKKPILWVKAKNADSGYLSHVFTVFNRLGFLRGNQESDWDVLWHHDYSFLDEQLREILLNLRPHQKVNHIPGSGYYTSKVNLALSNISGIPPAFKLPDEKEKLLKFAKSHPEKFWVQKSNKHRGIQIKKVEDLDLNQENSFIQEYVSNPLLIDGRKFDVGIYTIITSVSPLRAYIYDGEALLRFCPANYHPFDASILDKYVVSDDYTPTWQIPSLGKFYADLSFSHKESLNCYLRGIGKNPTKIWTQIKETIRQVLRSKEPLFNSLLGKFKNNARNFFELSRFDFVVDEDLNVFLMEANMSPNLSSGHFPPNKLLYEQVIYNLLNVAGIARHVHGESLKERSSDEEQMRVSDKDIQVYAELCSSSDCFGCGGEKLKCKICHRCLSMEKKQMLRSAFLEHLNRRNTRRVIPAPLTDLWKNDENAFDRHLNTLLTEDDKLLAWWFRGKCLQEESWCS